MTQATCLPASAARISERTNGVSSPTRYTVILIATVRGSSAAVADEALDAVVEALVGMMHEQIAGRDGLEDRLAAVETRRARPASTGASRSSGTFETGDLEQARVVELAGEIVDVLAR